MRSPHEEFPQTPLVHHELAHELQQAGDLPSALLSFQRALDLNTADYANHRCYGRCLHRHALTLSDVVVKRSSLEKARRLLSRAAVIGVKQSKGKSRGSFLSSTKHCETCPVAAGNLAVPGHPPAGRAPESSNGGFNAFVRSGGVECRNRLVLGQIGSRVRPSDLILLRA